MIPPGGEAYPIFAGGIWLTGPAAKDAQKVAAAAGVVLPLQRADEQWHREWRLLSRVSRATRRPSLARFAEVACNEAQRRSRAPSWRDRRSAWGAAKIDYANSAS